MNFHITLHYIIEMIKPCDHSEYVQNVMYEKLCEYMFSRLCMYECVYLIFGYICQLNPFFKFYNYFFSKQSY